MYTVIWRNVAMDELADAMVRCDLATQDLIERRVVALNARLAVDPLDLGESRSGANRIAFADPIGIFFDVDQGQRLVRVAHFWMY